MQFSRSLRSSMDGWRRGWRGVAFLRGPAGSRASKSVQNAKSLHPPQNTLKKPSQKPSKAPSKGLVLAQSAEAQRQLNAGNCLDSRPAKPVKVLEDFFNDADLYARPPDALKSARRPFATPAMPFASSALEVRGLHSQFMSQMYILRLGNGCRTVAHNPMFLAWYFPPWHPLAAGRVSRPALAISFGKGEQFNGAELKITGSAKNYPIHSRNPFDYAVWRLRTARKLRPAFFNAWSSENGPDGLYFVVARRVPTDREALVAAMRTFVLRARSSPDLQGSGTPVANTKAAKVNIGNLNRLLVSSHYAPVREYPRSEWEAAMWPHS